MMISEKIAKRLNEQVNHEFFSSWAYRAMAYWLDNAGYKGFAEWFFAQATEEEGHAVRIATYLSDQGAVVTLGSIAEPKTEYKSVQEIIEAALAHEKKVTQQVHEIADMAVAENDHATRKFIDWKIEEQVEEVSTLSDILDWVKMAQTPGELFILQGQLSRAEEQ